MNLCPHCNAYHSTEFARCPSCAERRVSSTPPDGSNGVEPDDATFTEDSHEWTRVRQTEPMSSAEPASLSPPPVGTVRGTDDGIETWDADVQMIGEVVEWQVRTLFHTPLDPEELPVDPEELPVDDEPRDRDLDDGLEQPSDPLFYGLAAPSTDAFDEQLDDEVAPAPPETATAPGNPIEAMGKTAPSMVARKEQAHREQQGESGVILLYTLILAGVALVGVALWGVTSTAVEEERPTRSSDQLSISPTAEGPAVGSIAWTPSSGAEEKKVEEATAEEEAVQEETTAEESSVALSAAPGFEFTVEEVELDAAAAGRHDINLMGGPSE